MSDPQGPRASPARRILSAVVKTAIVAALLWVLADRGLMSWSSVRAAYDQGLPWALGAHALLWATLFMAALRWHLVLHAQDIPLKFSRTLRLTFIGGFFNVALPGSVTGDLVKAYYIGHDAEGRRARAFGSIFFDRVLGLSALIIVVACAQLMGAVLTGPEAVLAGLRTFTVVLAAGTVGFYGYLFAVREDRDVVVRILVALEKRVKQVGALREFYLGMRAYHHHPGVVAKAIALSIVIHLFAGLACAMFGWAMGEAQLTVERVYASMPLGFLVTSIPVAPAGVGTGHAAFLFLIRLAGSERGADIFTLLALQQFIVGGVGGLVYLRFKASAPVPPVEPPAAA